MEWQRGVFPGEQPRHLRGRPRGTRVQHVRRPEVSARRPHHVTVRVRRGVWNLRSQRCFGRISRALRGVQNRDGFRVTHFSVQGNHLHLIVEADDRPTLTNGMRALLIRIARSLNALMGTRGRLYADRYHETIVTSRRQMNVVVRYVLENHAKHMRQIGKVAPPVDHFSSAVCTRLVLPSAFS
jgi:REP element-mobilizing transposase RayT